MTIRIFQPRIGEKVRILQPVSETHYSYEKRVYKAVKGCLKGLIIFFSPIACCRYYYSPFSSLLIFIIIIFIIVI